MKRENKDILSILTEREGYLIRNSINYFKLTAVLSIIFIILAVFGEHSFGVKLLPVNYDVFASPSIGGIIALIMGLFSSLIMFSFVICSLTFIPYIIILMMKSLQEFESFPGSKPFRLLPLCASAIVPMIVFSLLWESTFKSEFTYKEIHNTLTELLITLIGATLSSLIIWIIMSIVNRGNRKLISIYIFSFSILIYSAIYLTYSSPYDQASISLCIGILTYLVFGSIEKLSFLGRRIITYDLDDSLYEMIEEINIKNQQIASRRQRSVLKEAESNLTIEEKQIALDADEKNRQLEVKDQLLKIKAKRDRFDDSINSSILNVYDQKVQYIDKVYEIIADEYKNRIDKDIPKSLQKIKDEAGGLSSDELMKRLGGLINEMDNTLKDFPESFENLQAQITSVTDTMKERLQEKNHENKQIAE